MDKMKIHRFFFFGFLLKESGNLTHHGRPTRRPVVTTTTNTTNTTNHVACWPLCFLPHFCTTLCLTDSSARPAWPLGSLAPSSPRNHTNTSILYSHLWGNTSETRSVSFACQLANRKTTTSFHQSRQSLSASIRQFTPTSSQIDTCYRNRFSTISGGQGFFKMELMG